jgi:hypothetical protein
MMSETKKLDSRTKEQLLAEIEFLRRGGWAGQIGPTIRLALTVACILGVAYIARDAAIGVAHELAGKETNANVVWNFLNDFRVSVFFGWGAGMAGVLYGLKERHLRKKTVERLAKRVAELESRHDRNRSSSQLTPRGDTNPEDEQ